MKTLYMDIENGFSFTGDDTFITNEIDYPSFGDIEFYESGITFEYIKFTNVSDYSLDRIVEIWGIH